MAPTKAAGTTRTTNSLTRYTVLQQAHPQQRPQLAPTRVGRSTMTGRSGGGAINQLTKTGPLAVAHSTVLCTDAMYISTVTVLE